jgi:hypothetical protein
MNRNADSSNSIDESYSDASSGSVSQKRIPLHELEDYNKIVERVIESFAHKRGGNGGQRQPRDRGRAGLFFKHRGNIHTDLRFNLAKDGRGRPVIIHDPEYQDTDEIEKRQIRGLSVKDLAAIYIVHGFRTSGLHELAENIRRVTDKAIGTLLKNCEIFGDQRKLTVANIAAIKPTINDDRTSKDPVLRGAKNLIIQDELARAGKDQEKISVRLNRGRKVDLPSLVVHGIVTDQLFALQESNKNDIYEMVIKPGIPVKLRFNAEDLEIPLIELLELYCQEARRATLDIAEVIHPSFDVAQAISAIQKTLGDCRINEGRKNSIRNSLSLEVRHSINSTIDPVMWAAVKRFRDENPKKIKHSKT